MTGSVAKGPVALATVRVFQIDPTTRALTLVGAGTTDASGVYLFAVPGAGPFLLLASGGSYEDEATGRTLSLASMAANPTSLDDPLPGVMTAIVGGSTTSAVSLTPLSTIAAARIAELARSDPDALDAAEIDAVYDDVGDEFGLGVDPRGVAPLDFSAPQDAAAINADPDGPAARLGALLAGISQAAADRGVSDPMDYVDALGEDFSDGSLNGLAGAATVDLGGGSLGAGGGTSDLAKATADFLDSSENASSTDATDYTALTNAVSQQNVAPPGVNHAPSLNVIPDQSVVAFSGPQTVALAGLSPGVGESSQTLAVTATAIPVGQVTGLVVTGTGTSRSVSYSPQATGSAEITVTVTDSGGAANGGIDTFSTTFSVLITTAPTAAQSIASGRAALAARNIASADASFASATAIEPTNPEAAFLRAVTRTFLLFESQVQGSAETYTDTDGDGRYDVGEAFVDANTNGVFDAPRLRDLLDLVGQDPTTRSYFYLEAFTDGGNGFTAQQRYDHERFGDFNDDGNFDAAGEVFADTNSNGRRDIGEPYADVNGNDAFDTGEPFTDFDNDGLRDPAETFTDGDNDGLYDPPETFFAPSSDRNANGVADGEPFTDTNGNGFRDGGLVLDGTYQGRTTDSDGRRRGFTLPASFPDQAQLSEHLANHVLPELAAIVTLLGVADVTTFSTTLTATERGSEPFTDQNSNGTFDEGEPFFDANDNGLREGGEGFFDVNGNTTYDGPEPFTDLDGDGRHDDVGSFAGVVFDLDQADVKLLRAAVRGFAAAARIYSAHFVGIATPAFRNLMTELKFLDVQVGLIDANASLFTQRPGGAAVLAAAKTDAALAIDDYVAADALADAEVDDQTNDFYVVRDPLDSVSERNTGIKDHENSRTRLNAVRSALDAVTTIPDPEFTQQDTFTDADSNGLWFPGEPFNDLNGNSVFDSGTETFFDQNGSTTYDGPETLTLDHNNNLIHDTDDKDDAEGLNLALFFSGVLNPRTLLPALTALPNDHDPGDLDSYFDRTDLDAVSPTFGGTLPDRTAADLRRALDKYGELDFVSGSFGSVTLAPQDDDDPTPNGFFTTFTAPSFPTSGFYDFQAIDGAGADIRIHCSNTSTFEVIVGQKVVATVTAGTTTVDIDLSTLRESFVDANTNTVFDAGEAFTNDLEVNGIYDDGLKELDSFQLRVQVGDSASIDAVEVLH